MSERTQGQAMVVYAEAKASADGKETTKEIIKAAFEAAKNHWMVLDEDIQFSGAVVAIMELVNEDDRVRIKKEIDVLKALSALQSGIPVDMAQVLSQYAEDEEPIGLRKFWDETE